MTAEFEMQVLETMEKLGMERDEAIEFVGEANSLLKNGVRPMDVAAQILGRRVRENLAEQQAKIKEKYKQ